MKKFLKQMFFGFVSALFILVVFVIFSGCAILSMKPVKTGKIPGTDIYAVKNALNSVFFINTGDSYIMIEAGSDIKKIKTELGKAGIKPGSVNRIFLTHSDYDHLAALALFPDAEIYMSENEFPLINGTVLRNGKKGNSLPAGIDINKIIPLQNEQEFVFNDTAFKCIESTGHTIGSMSYLVNDKDLFTGDAFSIRKGLPGIHPFTMDESKAKKTIEQFSENIFPGKTIYTAHYGYRQF